MFSERAKDTIYCFTTLFWQKKNPAAQYQTGKTAENIWNKEESQFFDGAGKLSVKMYFIYLVFFISFPFYLS